MLQNKQITTAYNGVVLQNADAVLVHRHPNTEPRLWRGSDGLKREAERWHHFLFYFHIWTVIWGKQLHIILVITMQLLLLTQQESHEVDVCYEHIPEKSFIRRYINTCACTLTRRLLYCTVIDEMENEISGFLHLLWVSFPCKQYMFFLVSFI